MNEIELAIIGTAAGTALGWCLDETKKTILKGLKR